MLPDAAQRMDARAEQRLARVDVAHAGDDARVHEEMLHRDATAARERVQAPRR